MRLTFTKRNGRHDELLVERPGRAPETIECPKQGIIPHDMVHYAVESVLSHRGFLGMLADGRPAAFTTRGGVPEEAVERLVETVQAELWGARVPVAEFLAVYAHACDARGHAAAPVTADDVEAIRSRVDELTSQWRAVPVDGSMTLVLGG